jgi:hypothetical protein
VALVAIVRRVAFVAIVRRVAFVAIVWRVAFVAIARGIALVASARSIALVAGMTLRPAVRVVRRRVGVVCVPFRHDKRILPGGIIGGAERLDVDEPFAPATL